MSKIKTNYQRGVWAEKIALIYLWLKGYRLLAVRFGSGQKGGGKGEIDLIMKKRRTVVFIEVKYRQTLEEGLYAVRPMQQVRIRRNAELFLKRYPRFQGLDCRFDVVVLAAGHYPKHLRNAF